MKKLEHDVKAQAATNQTNEATLQNVLANQEKIMAMMKVNKT